MPWRECCKMDERLRFVARLLEGEKMAVLCREFDISRKTGYKILARYKDCGVEGLTDRSRRPYRHANRLPFQIETLIVQLKKVRPTWGAPKIREKIKRRYKDIQLPAISTVHAVLDRHGLVTRGRRARYHAEGTGLSTPTRPNDLWCADYKGEFMLADRRYCCLTVRLTSRPNAAIEAKRSDLDHSSARTSSICQRPWTDREPRICVVLLRRPLPHNSFSAKRTPRLPLRSTIPLAIHRPERRYTAACRAEVLPAGVSTRL